ncbi:alkylation response protein AidB-like acyl-CoA dehydrogenase [Micromonospora sp. Llam0]|uniref:acyl-CoA dehydrogenase family protein n=1 Tax=Micromonospora sp. Llam0 TaxID=2485143 RepID=UPI000F469E1E|nr:acyl-CoA dehydrogenase family protein [Micromonospora sp. Llam0]ROO60101.1 alkylation response protein AidB-like acyl-CoA dehydrogenase [Micromonospora sp. Llam0]
MSGDEPTDEAMLRQIVAEALTGVATGTLWATARDLGWLAVGVAEQVGGSGGTVRDAAAIVRAAAATAPELALVEAMQASWLLGEAGWLDPDRDEPYAVALPDPAETITLHTGLTGSATGVAGARTASALLVCAVAADDGRPVLARVDPAADGLRVTPGTNLAGEPRDQVTVRGCVPLRVAMTAPHAADVRRRESLLRAAALLGAVERTCQLTVDHVRVRTQFGRPLLAQQAVAHAVATMAGEREQCRAALRGALDAWGGDHAASRVAAARVIFGRAATTVARLAHQLHGAVGITREHPLHRSTGRLLAWRDEPVATRTASHTLGTVVAGGGDLWQWVVTDRIRS